MLKDKSKAKQSYEKVFTKLPPMRIPRPFRPRQISEHIRDMVARGYPVEVIPEETPFENLEHVAAYISGKRIDFKVRGLLRKMERGFNKSQDPLHAMQAFLIAMGNGLYPPLWAMEFLRKGFETYLRKGGNKKLDSILGFDVGRGGTPLLKREAIAGRDGVICEEVFKLTKCFDLSIDEAAAMVARKLEESLEWVRAKRTYYEVEYDSRRIGEETIRDRYLKIWKKTFEKIEQLLPGSFLIGDDNAKIRFLRTFPEDSHPRTPKGKTKPSLAKFLSSKK